MMKSEQVVLVDPSGEDVGIAEKLGTHERGLLHRAFSVMVLNPAGELLMQRRAEDKYHSGGRWANTCCGHPRPGEVAADAARRRLGEEMGFSCPIEPVGTLLYRAEVGAGLVEHEYDHLFLGRWAGTPRPDPAEVAAWRWVGPRELRQWIEDRPAELASWFPLVCRRLQELGVEPFASHAG
jgi:isopentenyl-diphosphate Delta-isomerase